MNDSSESQCHDKIMNLNRKIHSFLTVCSVHNYSEGKTKTKIKLEKYFWYIICCIEFIFAGEVIDQSKETSFVFVSSSEMLYQNEIDISKHDFFI